MQTMVGQQPKTTFDKSAVTFKPVVTVPDKTTASIAAISTYESASRIITKNFQGKEFASGSRKIVVQKVDLWAKDGKMIIEFEMTDGVNTLRDAIVLPVGMTMTDVEIEAMKQARFDNWLAIINTPVADEPVVKE
jgi:hypothetical protein